jgi:hypothetical protein
VGCSAAGCSAAGCSVAGALCGAGWEPQAATSNIKSAIKAVVNNRLGDILLHSFIFGKVLFFCRI